MTERIDNAYDVLEQLREQLNEEGRLGASETVNNAHAILQEYEDELVNQ